MKNNEEEKNKKILELEIVLGVVLVLIFLAIVYFVSISNISDSAKVAILIPTYLLFFVAVFYLLRIEQKTGYYECSKCHHKYVPSYWKVLWAIHMGRTRYMRCPECMRFSWQKKVLK